MNTGEKIKYLQKTVANWEYWNKFSYEKINQWELELNHLATTFSKQNQGLTYQEANALVAKEYNPNLKYNTKDLNRINQLVSLIDGEHFFIEQRKRKIIEHLRLIKNLEAQV